MKKEAGPVPLLCAASVEAADKIREIHHDSGYTGVRRTFYFVQLTNPSVSKSAVRAVVKECQTCQSIDPVPLVRLTAALDKRGFVCVWHAGQ